VRAQLGRWFGGGVRRWRHLRTYHIPFAQPDQAPPALTPWRRDVRVRPGLYVCGDHVDNASINGAMESGRRAADAVLRWEYRPGSTLFLVWTTTCSAYTADPAFDAVSDVRHLCQGKSSNVFAVKMNYWMSL
jgi:hypothetical protein